MGMPGKAERLQDLHKRIISVIDKFTKDPYLKEKGPECVDLPAQGAPEDIKAMSDIECLGKDLLKDMFGQYNSFCSEWSSPSCIVNYRDPYRSKCVAILKVYRDIVFRALGELDKEK